MDRPAGYPDLPPTPSSFAILLRQGYGGQEASEDRRLRGRGDVVGGLL